MGFLQSWNFFEGRSLSALAEEVFLAPEVVVGAAGGGEEVTISGSGGLFFAGGGVGE